MNHFTSIHYEPSSRRGALVLMDGHRARCSCGWSSDCYAMMSDTQRAIEVHLRRAKREDFDALIERSSIGAAIADVKARGIDAHLVDLEHEMNRAHRTRKAKRKASTGDDPLKIPHDLIVLREFIYSIGDRAWTDSDREHVLDLVRAILRRRGKRLT